MEKGDCGSGAVADSVRLSDFRDEPDVAWIVRPFEHGLDGVELHQVDRSSYARSNHWRVRS
jgi:hypothetical protein